MAQVVYCNVVEGKVSNIIYDDKRTNTCCGTVYLSHDNMPGYIIMILDDIVL